MGGGTSSIPNKIDKEAFKAIVQGALSDQIFDENSIDGVMVTKNTGIVHMDLIIYCLYITLLKHSE